MSIHIQIIRMVLKMKNWVKFTSMLLTVVLLTSCRNLNNTEPENSDSSANESVTAGIEPEVLKIKDFFPIRANVKYVYEGEGNEFAFYNMYIDYTSDNMVQQRINNGGTEIVKVIKVQDGRVIQLISKAETYYRENFLASDFNPDDEQILLMEPLIEGTKWVLKDSNVKTITNISAEVETPAGNFKAIEVTTTSPQNAVISIDYYVKDFGLVKTISSPGDNQISSILSKIEENAVFEQNVSFFYPDIADDKLYYEDKTIKFNTNDTTIGVLESAYKEATKNNLRKVISENSKINSMKLGSDNILHIDFNSAFMTEMNAGAMYESLILQSIANTFGKYYNVDKVSLTIENKIYESGHILLGADDYLKVDYKDAVKIEQLK